RAEEFAVGHLHAGDDDSHRAAAWRVFAVFAAGPRDGGVADWRGAGAVCGSGGGGGGGVIRGGGGGFCPGELNYLPLHFLLILRLLPSPVVSCCPAPLTVGR